MTDHCPINYPINTGSSEPVSRNVRPQTSPLKWLLSGLLGLAAGLLLFLFLFIPFSYSVKPLKMALLGLLLTAAIFFMVYRGRGRLSGEVLFLTIFYLALTSVFCLQGALRNAPGALDYFRLYAVWPAVSILLFTLISRLRHLRLLLTTLVLAAIAVSGYGLFYVLTSLEVLPRSWFFDVQGTTSIQTAAIGFHEGYIHYRLLSITGMPFLVPFITAALLTWPRRISPVPRSLLWAAFLLSITAMLFTGRRALFLVAVITPFMVIFFQLFLAGRHAPAIRRRRRYAVILSLLLLPAAFGLIHSFYDIDLGAMAARLQAAFNPSQDEGARVRANQIRVFSREIAARPFFGSGLGMALEEISRRPDKPQTAFELMYFTLVFNVGLAGFLLYCAGIAWLYFRAVTIFRSGGALGVLALPVFVGCAGFLLANATNPYLASFEFMWTLFLPVGVVNFYLVRRSRSRRTGRRFPDRSQTASGQPRQSCLSPGGAPTGPAPWPG